MLPGSVIVDIAAISGGNCVLTQPGKTISHQGKWIAGPTDLASSMAKDASTMYAKNLLSFLELFKTDGKFNIDWNDPILAQSVVTRETSTVEQSS